MDEGDRRGVDRLTIQEAARRLTPNTQNVAEKNRKKAKERRPFIADSSPPALLSSKRPLGKGKVKRERKGASGGHYRHQVYRQ